MWCDLFLRNMVLSLFSLRIWIRPWGDKLVHAWEQMSFLRIKPIVVILTSRCKFVPRHGPISHLTGKFMFTWWTLWFYNKRFCVIYTLRWTLHHKLDFLCFSVFFSYVIFNCRSTRAIFQFKLRIWPRDIAWDKNVSLVK